MTWLYQIFASSLLVPTGGTWDFLEQNHSKMVENSLSLNYKKVKPFMKDIWHS